ncbi:MAG: DUF2155 domain-containing protein [Nitrospirae bacterium]|nr:DUF2155 domain-containing protein [Nitrospirota bacterium]
MKDLKYFAFFLVAAFLVLGIGCKKKEETAPPPSAEKPSGAVQEGRPSHVTEEALVTTKEEKTVVMIPDMVKEGWQDIKIEVLNKQTSQKETVTVPIGGEADIPGSRLKIRAAYFLPEFTMEGRNITSASNEPKNPAAYIMVVEDGKEIFKGWLFAQFPSAHQFEHPNYSLALSEYTPKT